MRRRQLGLDELMIVNPGHGGVSEAVLLGDDGVLYRLRLVGRLVDRDPDRVCPCRSAGRGARRRRPLLRAANGRLYEVIE